MAKLSAAQQLLQNNQDKFLKLILSYLQKYTRDKQTIANIEPHLEQISRETGESVPDIMAFTLRLQGLFLQIEQFCTSKEIGWEGILGIMTAIQDLDIKSTAFSKIFSHEYFKEMQDLDGIFSQNIKEYYRLKNERDAEINYWSRYQKEYTALKTDAQRNEFFARHKAKFSAQQSLAMELFGHSQWGDPVSDKHLVLDFDGVLGDTFEGYCKIIFLYEINGGTNNDFEACKKILSDPNFTIPENDLEKARRWIWGYLAKPKHNNLGDEDEKKSTDKLAKWGELLEMLGYKYFETFINSIYGLKEKGFKISVVSNTPENVLNKLTLGVHANLFENALGRESGGSKLKKIQTFVDELSEVIYVTDAPTDVLELQNHIPIILGVDFGFFKDNLEPLASLLPEHQLIKGENGIVGFMQDPREEGSRSKGFTDFTTDYNWQITQREILEFYRQSENQEILGEKSFR